MPRLKNSECDSNVPEIFLERPHTRIFFGLELVSQTQNTQTANG